MRYPSHQPQEPTVLRSRWQQVVDQELEQLHMQ
jgi:hypothetical protein